MFICISTAQARARSAPWGLRDVSFAYATRPEKLYFQIFPACFASLLVGGSEAALRVEHACPSPAFLDKSLYDMCTTCVLCICYNTIRPEKLHFQVLLRSLLVHPKLWRRKPWRRCWGLQAKLFEVTWNIYGLIIEWPCG